MLCWLGWHWALAICASVIHWLDFPQWLNTQQAVYLFFGMVPYLEVCKYHWKFTAGVGLAYFLCIYNFIHTTCLIPHILLACLKNIAPHFLKIFIAPSAYIFSTDPSTQGSLHSHKSPLKYFKVDPLCMAGIYSSQGPPGHEGLWHIFDMALTEASDMALWHHSDITSQLGYYDKNMAMHKSNEVLRGCWTWSSCHFWPEHQDFSEDSCRLCVFSVRSCNLTQIPLSDMIPYPQAFGTR